MGSFAKPKHAEASLGSPLVALRGEEVVCYGDSTALVLLAAPQRHGMVPAGGRCWSGPDPFFLYPAGKGIALPCVPRPVALSGPAWWDMLCLNPTRNMLVPDGHRQKKRWFNFCSKGQRSPLTDLLARRCRASLEPQMSVFACFG